MVYTQKQQLSCVENQHSFKKIGVSDALKDAYNLNDMENVQLRVKEQVSLLFFPPGDDWVNVVCD